MDSPRPGPLSRFFPLLIVIAGLAYIISVLMPHDTTDPYDLQQFGQLPVLHEGRIKPIDTAARASLMLMSNKQTLRIPVKDKPGEFRRLSAVEWLLDVVTHPEQADDYPVFRIDHPDIKTLIGVTDPQRNTFSLTELSAKGHELNEQLSRAFKVDVKQRTLYQTKLLDLGKKLIRYQALARFDEIVPVFDSDAHAAVIHGQDVASQVKTSPAMASFIEVLRAYHEGKPGDFNASVARHHAEVRKLAPSLAARTDFEAFFHRVEPFYVSMVLYVGVFLLAAFSWLGWAGPLGRAAVALTCLTLVLHTAGLATRVYLHGHPPVTNLYASAIFIGWVCVVLSLVVDLIWHSCIGVAVGSMIGFVTLLIAHNLSDGDNLEAVRAVLDTNLWLSTHVVVVTIGYSSTFLAGGFSIIFVLGRLIGGIWQRVKSHPMPALVMSLITCLVPFLSLTAGVWGFLNGRPLLYRPKSISDMLDWAVPRPESIRLLGRLIYGIICFAALASFVGTILGGIWADQSWGRFWGWDPKENGALLIVMANVLILHARWGGMVRERGMAVLAIGGNIVTAWSWFGVNMLGVGLHSYGFMDKALGWLLTFVGSQLILMAIGLIPLRYWCSFSSAATPAAVPPQASPQPV
ncbi:MAG: cytochrome c biogenesis protein CcsA [Planctomycetes bacterium]|nr:cytochrome c biogenesis protein CcsA [Planctomycetota bacterium]